MPDPIRLCRTKVGQNTQLLCDQTLTLQSDSVLCLIRTARASFLPNTAHYLLVTSMPVCRTTVPYGGSGSHQDMNRISKLSDTSRLSQYVNQNEMYRNWAKTHVWTSCSMAKHQPYIQQVWKKKRLSFLLSISWYIGSQTFWSSVRQNTHGSGIHRRKMNTWQFHSQQWIRKVGVEWFL